MLKIEYIWRELLYQTIEVKNPFFQVNQLAKKFRLSTSVVAHSLAPLKGLGIIKVNKTRSQVINAEKLLFYWATRRKLAKDILYQTHTSLPIKETESSLPPNVHLTAFSAMRLYYQRTPADYDHIYLYCDKIDTVRMRFLPKKGEANLFVLAQDPFLSLYPRTPLGQIFADLWNLPEWYARDFWQDLYGLIQAQIGL